MKYKLGIILLFCIGCSDNKNSKILANIVQNDTKLIITGFEDINDGDWDSVYFFLPVFNIIQIREIIKVDNYQNYIDVSQRIIFKKGNKYVYQELFLNQNFNAHPKEVVNFLFLNHFDKKYAKFKKGQKFSISKRSIGNNMNIFDMDTGGSVSKGSVSKMLMEDN